MDEFKINFLFDHSHYTAHVATHKAADHIQYTVSPEDKALKKKFATQVIHRFGDALEFAFPGQGPEAEQYNRSLETALRHTLKLK
jgi:hypothetical protein